MFICVYQLTFILFILLNWMTSSSLRNTILGCKTVKAGKRFISQNDRLRIYSCKFFTVNALRNGRLGVYCQEETYLNFSQADGKIKTILVNKKSTLPCIFHLWILVIVHLLNWKHSILGVDMYNVRKKWYNQIQDGSNPTNYEKVNFYIE